MCVCACVCVVVAGVSHNDVLTILGLQNRLALAVPMGTPPGGVGGGSGGGIKTSNPTAILPDTLCSSAPAAAAATAAAQVLQAPAVRDKSPGREQQENKVEYEGVGSGEGAGGVGGGGGAAAAAGHASVEAGGARVALTKEGADGGGEVEAGAATCASTLVSGGQKRAGVAQGSTSSPSAAPDLSYLAHAQQPEDKCKAEGGGSAAKAAHSPAPPKPAYFSPGPARSLGCQVFSLPPSTPQPPIHRYTFLLSTEFSVSCHPPCAQAPQTGDQAPASSPGLAHSASCVLSSPPAASSSSADNGAGAGCASELRCPTLRCLCAAPLPHLARDSGREPDLLSPASWRRGSFRQRGSGEWRRSGRESVEAAVLFCSAGQGEWREGVEAARGRCLDKQRVRSRV